MRLPAAPSLKFPLDNSEGNVESVRRMSRPLRQIAPLAAATALALVALPCAGAAASETVSPLPGSNYAVRAACTTPSPGRAGCLALQLVPVTAEARRRTHPIGMVRAAARHATAASSPKEGDFGLRPQDLHSAYSLPASVAGQQTIALVDAYNDPSAESDLKAYDEEFGLPPCTAKDECFRKVGQTGSSEEAGLPFPKSSQELEEAEASGNEGREAEAEEAVGWGGEISLDIETAHAVCQSCHILLVEASSSEYSDLEAAEERGALLGATEISNSWGGNEQEVSALQDNNSPFNHPGIVITASTGDNGFLGWDAPNLFERGYAEYPASSPHVVAVGGTRLSLGAGSSWSGETAWNGYGASGGGCSVRFTAPAWQQQAADWSSVGCGSQRAEADVSADADPYTGVAVMDTSPECETPEHTHWCTYGGTSLASPIVAAVFALAGGADEASYPAQTIYENLLHAPGTLHDVTAGSNGKCASGYNSEGISRCTASSEASASCSSTRVCWAGPGYDGPSGVGTPNGILGFEPGQEEAAASKQGGGGQAGGTGSSTPVAAAQPTAQPVSSAAAAPVSVQLSGLGLTTPSVIALNQRRPTTAKVGFSFSLNMPARIRVSLARQVRSHGHRRWAPVGRSTTIAAVAGHNSRRLTGGRRLAAGLYRLTLSPLNGKARSILFHIG